MIFSKRDDCRPYVTMDGSLIRELMHPGVHGNHAQSLAEATISVGQQTTAHKHLHTEELYYVRSGTGLMFLGDEQRSVAPGDTVAIPPGTVHSIRNTGAIDLVVLCACTPAYSHDDTVIID